MSEKNKPVHEIRMGPVKLLVWENEPSKGIRHNVTVSRLYKDGEEWKETRCDECHTGVPVM